MGRVGSGHIKWTHGQLCAGSATDTVVAVDIIEKAKRRGRLVAVRARIAIILNAAPRNRACWSKSTRFDAGQATLHDARMDDGIGTGDRARHIRRRQARPCVTSWRLDLFRRNDHRAVCAAGFMKRYGVCLSQYGPTAASPLLQVCCCGPGGQEILIDCCSSGVRRANSSSATLSAYTQVADHAKDE